MPTHEEGESDMLDALFAKFGPTMDTAQVAEILHISTQTVMRLVADNHIPAYKPARAYIFVTDDVKAYLRSTQQ